MENLNFIVDKNKEAHTISQEFKELLNDFKKSSYSCNCGKTFHGNRIIQTYSEIREKNYKICPVCEEAYIGQKSSKNKKFGVVNIFGWLL